MSKGLDPDQNRCFVGLDLSPKCLQRFCTITIKYQYGLIVCWNYQLAIMEKKYENLSHFADVIGALRSLINCMIGLYAGKRKHACMHFAFFVLSAWEDTLN